jgi:prohibitin 1
MANFFRRVVEWFDDNLVKTIVTLVVVTLIVVVLWPLSVVTIPAGYVGVLYHRFGGGTQTDRVYSEGTHVILPWDIMTPYNIRLHLIEHQFDALTSDGLEIKVNVAFRFHLEVKNVALLHKFIGPDYLNSLLVSDIGSETRHAFVRYRPEDVYSPKRKEIEDRILERVEAYLTDRFNPDPLTK